MNPQCDGNFPRTTERGQHQIHLINADFGCIPSRESRSSSHIATSHRPASSISETYTALTPDATPPLESRDIVPAPRDLRPLHTLKPQSKPGIIPAHSYQYYHHKFGATTPAFPAGWIFGKASPILHTHLSLPCLFIEYLITNCRTSTIPRTRSNNPRILNSQSRVLQSRNAQEDVLSCLAVGSSRPRCPRAHPGKVPVTKSRHSHEAGRQQRTKPTPEDGALVPARPRRHGTPQARNTR